MKKLLITLSILLSGFYITSAINLNLSSGEVLTNSSWQEVSNITGKIKLNSRDINISGKLVSSGKICAGNKCLGECESGYIWDTSTNSCIIPATTPETAGETCYEILQSNPSASDGNYYIDPNLGDKSDAFEVYCDMTTDGGGWTLFARRTSGGLMESGEVNLSSMNSFNINTRKILFTNIRLDLKDENNVEYNKKIIVSERSLETGLVDVSPIGESGTRWKTDLKMTTSQQKVDNNDLCGDADLYTLNSSNDPNAFFGHRSYYQCSYENLSGYYGYYKAINNSTLSENIYTGSIIYKGPLISEINYWLK